jgi:hypothetical protein
LGIVKKWHAKVIAEVLERGKKKKKKQWKKRQK